MGMEEEIKKIAKPASSTKHSGKVVRTVSRADLVELNRTLDPIIEQNRRERIASWEEMHDKIVGK